MFMITEKKKFQAAKYLCTPPATVYSEKVSNIAGPKGFIIYLIFNIFNSVKYILKFAWCKDR